MNSNSRVPVVVRQLAERGARLFPLAPNTKVPFKGWFWKQRNTSDPQELEEYAREVELREREAGQPCNWAMTCGHPSEQFLMDIDGEGMPWYIDKLNTYGVEWADTMRVRSPKGVHVHLNCPQDFEVGCKDGGIAPGIDIKGNGGYSIMPPSQVGGKAYTFEDCDVDKPLLDPPAWLLAELRRLFVPQPKEPKPEFEEPKVSVEGKINEGQRTNVLKRAALELFKAGINRDGLLAHFRGLNRDLFNPRYPDEYLKYQAEHLYGWAEEHLKKKPVPLGFVFTSVGNLFAEPDLPMEYVVDGLLVAGSVSGVFAKPKVGKSTFARNLCLAVSRGTPFMGMRTRQGLCLYLALEERKQDIVRDFRAMGATGGEPIEVHVGPSPPDAIVQICDLVRDRKPVLLVVDPLFRAVRVKDDGSYAELYSAIGPFIDISRETGTHIHFTHHSGKTSKEDPVDAPLGSTGIAATVNSVIIMKKGKSYRTLETVQRVYPAMEETVLDFDESRHLLSIGKTKIEVDEMEVGRRMLKTLDGVAGGMTEDELMEAVEGDTGLKRRALRKAVDDELVYRQGTGKRGHPFRYFLVSRLLPIGVDDKRETDDISEVEQDEKNENALDTKNAKDKLDEQ